MPSQYEQAGGLNDSAAQPVGGLADFSFASPWSLLCPQPGVPGVPVQTELAQTPQPCKAHRPVVINRIKPSPRARLLFRARTESDAAASQQEQTRGSNYSSAQPVGGLADFSFASLGHPPAFPDNIPDVDTPPSADCGPPFVIGRETLPRTESLDIWSSIHNFWYFRERGFLLESEELRRLIFSKQKHPVPEDLWIPGEGVDQCVSAVVSVEYVLQKLMDVGFRQGLTFKKCLSRV